MSNERPAPRVYRLQDEVARITNAEPGFVLELGDKAGTRVTIPPTALWDDELLTLANTQPPKAVARLLGGESYRKFTDAGGNSALLMRLVRDHEGATDTGESSASDGS